MPVIARPHDLLWLRDRPALQGAEAGWVTQLWHPGLPVVVRRDQGAEGLIPVGVRGMKREQRAAGWVARAQVVRQLSPHQLAEGQALLRSPFVSQPPVQAAILLAQQHWPWQWGITGSTGYALATDIPVLHAESDLDLVIYAPQPPDPDALRRWQQALTRLPCRADTQLETPLGAFALNEWQRDGQVLLKTDRGPRLTRTPWHREQS
ncbi:phosphoribosyl-dephospho-CoA transferase [Chimaeribacter californicus]|uniref:Phosphoribosyl-dephospho-CoA transferase n=1 Tax=Chimaeribacter californicus TaxID=2060067 RepID=A0A2N5E4K8_9GAMM|nr:malonate decarboxylase holo-ACP synthase [Chimaeribacter californicus]PLR35930.1 phosphoribosyl-dephospho-CoA transferase [Chimaeribacter californicus]